MRAAYVIFKELYTGKGVKNNRADSSTYPQSAEKKGKRGEYHTYQEYIKNKYTDICEGKVHCLAEALYMTPFYGKDEEYREYNSR